ncbi:TPA: N-6 DNA methylase, partial [Candidatus Micrarchaeota archaeon]|nr:N-6 DNA methylase [Candidatus Micrarchaeota archaeon]
SPLWGEGKGEGDNADSRLRHLLSYTDDSHQFTSEEVDKLIDAIDNAKILDPACGSGAFPMGILHKLVYILGKLDPNNDKWKQKQINKVLEVPDVTVREKLLEDIEQSFRNNELDYGRKLYLIENSIFGVDIQPIAVQIAKLRFFISLIVDQKTHTVRHSRESGNPEIHNLGIRPLPNLETKFVAANTLIGIEKPQQLLLRNPEIDKKEEELKKVTERHFTARTPKTKEKYRQEDERLRAEISELLKRDGFPRETTEKMAQWNPYDQSMSAAFFDPEWMFSLRDGFDIVMGNPPYLRVQGLQQTQPQFVPVYRQRYVSAQGSFDIYALFVERGFQLLDKTGYLTYILPHKFFQASFGGALRKLLTENKALHQIVRFGAEQVFEEATTYTCLLFLSKTSKESFKYSEIKKLENPVSQLGVIAKNEKYENGTLRIGTIPLSGLSEEPWQFGLGKEAELLGKLNKIPLKLGDVTMRMFQGIRTSANEVYVLKKMRAKGTFFSVFLQKNVELEPDIMFPFLKGQEIRKWKILPSDLYVLIPYTIENGHAELISEKAFLQRYPKTWEYLVNCKKHLENREKGKMKGSKWYGYVYPKNLEIMLKQKTLTRDIVESLSFSPDFEGKYVMVTGYGLTFKDGVRPSFVLGLINSSVLNFYFKHISTPLRGGFFRAFPQYLERLPILIPDVSIQNEIEKWVLKVVELHQKQVQTPDLSKKELLEREAKVYEEKIDQLVYDLYGLKDKEIEIVEGFNKEKTNNLAVDGNE